MKTIDDLYEKFSIILLNDYSLSIQPFYLENNELYSNIKFNLKIDSP